ncbi:MAG: archaellin/type IV pilin N-terminal domain-containing protein [Candidatus Woesearchaeota archaeon]
MIQKTILTSKRAEMGIGTLILFIAFILVAAVAASVLISTTSTLQSKALNTGKQTTDEVGTSMTAVQIYAEDASDNSVDKMVDYFYYTIKLSAGSEPIRFADVLMTMNTNNVSQDYTYYGDTGYSAGCSGTAALDGNTSKYFISYSLSSSQQTNGYIFPGDVVKLCFKSPRSIGEAEEIKINMVPKIGASLVVDTTMPSLMRDKRIYVFP